MSESHSTERVDELRDIFVAVTGDDTVVEPQDDETGDREIADARVDVEDGLDDAVAGAETGGDGDPAA